MYDFSTIILSHNDREFLEKCLASYKKAENPPVSEIIVVDNASRDGSAEMVENSFPDVKLIKNKKNLGVAPARNQGFKVSNGKHLLFLDSDTEMHRGTLSALFNFIEENKDVAVAGPKILNPDGTLQYSCRTFPTPLTFLMRGLKIGKNSRIINDHLMKDIDYEAQREVDFVIGACMAVRRDVFEKLNMFDEKYFFGYEDPDLCYRAKVGGWKTVYVPRAKITHHYRRRSAHRWIFNRLKWSHGKSALRFFKKRYL